MTKPKLLPSLCKQMSIVFDMRPEVLFGAETEIQVTSLKVKQGLCWGVRLGTYLWAGAHTPPPGELALPRSSAG